MPNLISRRTITEYTAGEDYNSGQIITYQGGLYRVTAVITNAPATPPWASLDNINHQAKDGVGDPLAPVDDSDLATKKYVDDTVSSGSAIAGYTYRSDTGYLIGASSVLNFTTAGAVGTTSDAATLRLDATAIRVLRAGTVKVTWSGKNSDGRRAQIRVGGSNLQETGTGQPANSFSTIQEVVTVAADANIQIRNPGTGGASWNRWSMTVEFVAS